MATPPSSTHDEHLVTLKISFENFVRRYKLPLDDMKVNVLESKVRKFLNITGNASCVFERYSDSASAYIVLNPENPNVYKQLFRAARAKSKLKLRVTCNVPENNSHTPHQNIPASSTSPSAKPVAVSVEEVPEPAMSIRNIVNKMPSQQETSQEPHVSYINPEESSKDAKPNGDSALPVVPSVTTTTTTTTTHPFAVCCNSCDRNIIDQHYHCSTCDDGDFDLCEACIYQGITCHGPSHWLIKRSLVNGCITCSTTETIPPKIKPAPEPKHAQTAPHKSQHRSQPKSQTRSERRHAERVVPIISNAIVPTTAIRTCNCCIKDYPEANFLHCAICDDFDLCQDCFAKDSHGHNPKHGFAPAVQGLAVPDHIAVKLKPGRSTLHNAICDGCEKFITGIRHKCLDCPDWDYCSGCFLNAKFIHAKHRFVPAYEPLAEAPAANSRAIHHGICCDGPLCSSGRSAYITGIRYKCAVCHDTDFCANCESNPYNTHNKTHPLIKFKTPVRHVSVTTNGESEDGQKMQTMGDRYARQLTSSRATETPSTTRITMQGAQTVVDVTPAVIKLSETLPHLVPEPSNDQVANGIKAPSEEKLEVVPKVEVSEEIKPEVTMETTKQESQLQDPKERAKAQPPQPAEGLQAMYLRDTIADGTVMPPNHVFVQTWIMRNSGGSAWPAGCSVKYVGGDYMGRLDSNRPVGISELVSASESTVCYKPLLPGEEFPFSVMLRTPTREEKATSFWRVTSPDGVKFGDRLWCEVDVKVAPPPQDEAPSSVTDKKDTMIFPKLETESPDVSVHEAHKDAVLATESAPGGAVHVEECGDLGEWDDSDEGFLTDEEYDILDASDEEYLVQQQKKTNKA